MRRSSTRALLAWSLVGLIGGHQAAYLLLYRDPAVITGMLDASGHGWMLLGPVFVISAAMTALVVGFQGSDPIRSFRWRFAFLALIQVAAFVTVEFAERSASGVDVRPLLGDDWFILVVGSLLQVAVALLLALASRVVERVALAFAGRRTAVPRRRTVSLLRPSTLAVPGAILPGLASAPRAPPVRA
jgi:hypothetical protein